MYRLTKLAPANWSLKFNACGGKEQSPINFDPNGPSVQQMTFGGFKFGDGHYKSNDGEWYNDGRTGSSYLGWYY